MAASRPTDGHIPDADTAELFADWGNMLAFEDLGDKWRIEFSDTASAKSAKSREAAIITEIDILDGQE